MRMILKPAASPLYVLVTGLIVACLQFICPSPVVAGDFASREILGFSFNGGLFAFEEYGVQDGSGFPYSNIYLIDTATDQWVANSPYRAVLQDETKEVYEAREAAKILAGPVLKSFEGRGQVVATNRATEIIANPKRMSAFPRIAVPPIDAPLEFRIIDKYFPTTPECEGFGEIKGFTLLQVDIEPGATTKVLHEDNSIPASRHCPLGYEFADIITYYPQNAPPVAAILILMKTIGFEGPDGRFLAVTTELE